MNIIIIHHLPSRQNGRPNFIAKYLAKRNHKIYMIYWDVPFPFTMRNIINNITHSLSRKEYVEEGIKIYKIRKFPFYFPIVNKYLFKKQIKGIYYKNDCDVIISESFINETEPPLELPIIYSMVDDFILYSQIYGSKLYKLAYKLFQVKETINNQIKDSRAVVVVSDYLFNEVNKINNNVFKIPNGFEKSILLKKNEKVEKYSLIYLTMFTEWSNLIPLLYSINLLKKDYPNIYLHLVGDGPYLQKGIDLINKLDLNKNVKIHGFIKNKEIIYSLINKSEVCLNLSDKNKFRDSSSPMKIFEYIALKKKIVSTKLSEVVSLKYPNIFYYNDISYISIAEAIDQAFKSKNNNTYKNINNYTWDNIVSQFESVILNNIKYEKSK